MEKSTLRLKRLGIDTHKEAVIYMRQDCHACLAEGFDIHARIKVSLGERFIIATLNIVSSELLKQNEAGLSEYAWQLLAAHEGDRVRLSHAKPISSMSFVRSKIYGNTLSYSNLKEIINDVTLGYYSDIHISAFLTACAGGRMKKEEISNLTKAMVEVGNRLQWHSDIVVDKHSVGGLPGNRTTPIIVPIVAAFGLIMPKTSSRAITSPAGTADVMEVLAPVEMDVATMKHVVEKENGCIVAGGSVSLSPADDLLIRIEKVLDLDSESQLVASVLSKKVAAGSTHVLLDVPVGPTAKVRSQKMADLLKDYLEFVGRGLGITVKVLFTDGSEPIGRGIGPALEARDIVCVLKGELNGLQKLREKSLMLAGEIIEFSSHVSPGEGIKIATEILDSGKAWKKFQAICKAQGGMKKIPVAKYMHPIKTQKNGTVVKIDNRRIALIAKLAGAPRDKIAGIDLHKAVGSAVKNNDVLFTIHANSPGELEYALDYLHDETDIIMIQEQL